IVEKGFLQIGDIVSSLNVLQKKSLCLWLRDLPPDPGRKYSVRKILSLMKISRASYYAILKNGTYGQSVVQRNAQDEQDAELIRTVMEYKGFAKGSRQIYMMMPALTGKRMGLKKIRRIMKTYNLTSSIRKAAPSKRMGGAALKKNVRPNLLQRRFRLYRPNEVRLTDVTHLLYGDGCKAYGSALLDPVTSKLVAFLVSEHNDLELALATLRQSDLHPCVSGGLYHSDQGTVYLSGAFQQEVSKRGYTQSMSKRGNCQDNAPQESFFGHFKDECPYSECKDIEELRELVARYAEYYNYERRMWDKGRMTPVEYEQYLLAMNEAEFSLYIAKEEEKYQQMKEKAAQRAIERAKNLGV
ncbi:IS3 family transposase, partial [Bacteroides thetaiotaomicron]